MNASMKPNAAHERKDEDAIALLTADHKKVKGLFGEFKKLVDKEDADAQKAALVAEVCDDLKVHAEIEEQIFYPAVRKAIDDGALMDEALVEHAGAKELIAQLEEMDPEDDLYDAKVTVLGEQIEHHVKEEEGDMFVKAKKAKLDLGALGAQLAKRKSELMAKLKGASAPRKSADKERSRTAN